jgi:hypothetical protein
MDGAAFAKRQIHILQQYFSLHIAQNACPSTDSRHTTTKTVRYRANINSPRHTANLCRVPMDRKVGSQCFASVLSPCGFPRLSFSLAIEATGSRSSAQKPALVSRPLYAGRRPPSHQASGGLVPGGGNAPGFDDGSLDNDASSKGSLAFVSPTHTCPRWSSDFCSSAHDHGS